MKIKYSLLISVIFILGSCEEFLKEEPKAFIAPNQYYNTEDEVTAAIYGVYDYLNLTGIAEFEWIFLGDCGTDVTVTRNTARHSYQFSTLENFRFSDVGGNFIMWQDYYSAIGAANSVIKRIEDKTNLDNNFKKRIIAEAKFLRGFFYLHLNLIYGSVPMWLDELNLDEVEYLGTTSSEIIRTQIIKDLSEAATDLPPTTTENGRVTSWAAKGLLARVYLFDEQWQKAKDMAKDIIDNSGHSLLPSYYDVFYWKNKFNNELIHVVPKLADIEGSRIHSHASPRPFDDNNFFEIPEGEFAIRPDGFLTRDKNSRNPGSLFQGWGEMQSTKENYDSFELGDSRRDMWWHELKFTDGSSYTFSGGSSNDLPGRSGYYDLKWIAWDEKPNNGSRDIILQRLSEIYLILAEAENEINGPTPEAYEAINTIRRRAFGDNQHDLKDLSKNEFRKAIIDENRWELGGEGLRRWYLWHWGYDVYLDAAEFIKESNPLLVQNLKPHHKWFKIPSEEIIKNPNLIQNPGYE